MKYAEVAVDARAGHSRTFTYSIPENLVLKAGQLIRVPFGSRRLQGIVFSIGDTPNYPDTRDVFDVVDHIPALSEVHLELAKWISGYYMCSLFEAVAPMLPPKSRTRSRVWLSLTQEADHIEDGVLSASQARIIKYMRDRGEVDQIRLAKALGDRILSSVSSLVRKGLVKTAQPEERSGVPAKYEQRLTLTKGLSSVSQMLDSLATAPRQKELLIALMNSVGPILVSEARKRFGASIVKALLGKGFIAIQKERVYRNPLESRNFKVWPEVKLTTAQTQVTEQIGCALADKSIQPRTFLLHGVTGSGKTEVYLDALTRCIAGGRKAIFLVPEIALTHQTIERLEGRFPGKVAVQHSGLKLGERSDQWWRLKQGSYDIVVGSRGAVFAPQPDLGLVIVDEEHEWTYKQEGATPRYHARDVALRLAALTDTVVVLGSASPDVLSYRRAERGIFKLLSLPERITADREGVIVQTSLADVSIIDMRREARDGNTGVFSRALLGELASCLDAEEQAILFLNRRGTASHMMCRACGFAVKCRRCDVVQRYHKDLGRLICHHCGVRRMPKEQCPQCLAFKLDFYGIGTEGLVAAVEQRFPEVEVLRWDRDSAKTLDDMARIVSEFQEGKAQVLIGTQMIAKGLHFPQVTLVGVVSADTGLGVPDFRAVERTFQVLCQVAGRAGRGVQKGKVVFQTYQPEHYGIRAAAKQDYSTFYSQEIDLRKNLGYTPFGRLIRLLYQHTNSTYAEDAATELAVALRRERDVSGMGDPLVLGPVPGFPTRLRGRYRWGVVLKGLKPRALLDKVTLPHGWEIDVDPATL